MKFCKRYEEYMEGRRGNELPGVGLKQLKMTLKRCSREFRSQGEMLGRDEENPDGNNGVVVSADDDDDDNDDGGSNRCPDRCPVCDGTFFPSLLNEMSAVVGCFNERAKKLLQLHLSSGFRKYFLWFRRKLQRDHVVLIQEGKDLVTYAIINSIAMRKILKKYDKVHYSKQGQAFRSQAQNMHIEILQSPWLCQLMAFYINVRQSMVGKRAIPGLFADCNLMFDDDKPILSCGLFDSVKLEIDLTCSICLDTVFDPVSLSCGHIFCYTCCRTAASVTIIDRIRDADPKAKCPLCRQEGVYKRAVHLDELNILLSRSCPDYWEKRLQAERVERVRQVKQHWESQCRSFMGI